MPTRCRLAFLLAVLVGVAGSARGDDPKPVELRPAWQKGEKRKYEMGKMQVRATAGQVVRKTAGRLPVEVEVIEAGDKGFVLRWTQGKMTFDDPNLAEQPLLKALSGITDGMVLELEVDRDGELLGLRNWKALQETGRKATDAVFEELGKAGLPKATLDTLRAEMEKQFAGKEAIEMSFTRQPGLLFLALGHTYDPAKPTAFDVELPNPFGGDPIPAKGELAMKKLDAGVAHVAVKQTPDPKKLTEVLDKTMRDLAKKLGQQAPPKIPEFAMEDTADVAVEAKTGWVRSLTHTRLTRTGPVTQTETTTFTRLDK